MIKDKLVGQKSYEEFHVKKENIFALHNDGSVFKLQLHKEINVETKLNIEKIDNIKKLKIYFKRRFKDYFPIKSKFKISQSI